MSVLKLDKVRLTYGGGVVAVDDVSLELEQGEFLTLLGPSGSGKTSTLRLIGGFERPVSGTIHIAGRDVTRIPPSARETATIFQSGALFPHKTVAENVAYGLRMRKLGRAEIETRVRDILNIVALSGYEDRLPAQMSGGQRQRVALARSLVVRPRVLLFDEPLSALDLSLKIQLRAEIKRLHEELGFTAVYVTHDQSEAMSMSDRVAVMNAGAIAQIDTPDTIYNHPKTEFVCTFIGEPCVLPLHVEAEAIRDSAGTPISVSLNERPANGAYRLYLRPGRLRLGTDARSCPNRLQGQLRMTEFLGESRRYHIHAGNLRLVADSAGPVTAAIGDEITVGWADCDARWFS